MNIMEKKQSITTVVIIESSLTQQQGNGRNEAKARLNVLGINAVCDQIADCVPLRKIAESAGVSVGTLCGWLASSEHAEQYLRAREAQADHFAAEILSIADERSNDTYTDSDGIKRTDHDAIARSRLRVEARKWLASKMYPKKYGDRVAVDQTVTASPLADAFARMTANGSAIPISTAYTGLMVPGIASAASLAVMDVCVLCGDGIDGAGCPLCGMSGEPG
jgi:hypothetical protein